MREREKLHVGVRDLVRIRIGVPIHAEPPVSLRESRKGSYPGEFYLHHEELGRRLAHSKFPRDTITQNISTIKIGSEKLGAQKESGEGDLCNRSHGNS